MLRFTSRTFSFFKISLLILLFLEIAGFIVVGRTAGLWPTLILFISTTLLGKTLIKRQYAGSLQNLSRNFTTQVLTPRQSTLKPGLLIAGILLVIPGFITDIIGLLLLLPALRLWLSQHVLSHFFAKQTQKPFSFQNKNANTSTDAGPIIDLDKNSYEVFTPNEADSSKKPPTS